MEKVVRIFHSQEEADEADREFYRSLTPQQRMDIFVELQENTWPWGNGAEQGLARVYRVVKRGKG